MPDVHSSTKKGILWYVYKKTTWHYYLRSFIAVSFEAFCVLIRNSGLVTLYSCVCHLRRTGKQCKKYPINLAIPCDNRSGKFGLICTVSLPLPNSNQPDKFNSRIYFAIILLQICYVWDVFKFDILCIYFHLKNCQEILMLNSSILLVGSCTTTKARW